MINAFQYISGAVSLSLLIITLGMGNLINTPPNSMPMYPYLKIMRPLNSVMATVGVFVGALVAGGTAILAVAGILPVLLAMLSVFFFMGAGNGLNDCMDAEVDAKNHPERPIPSGKISRKHALNFSILLFIVAGFLAAFINPYALAVELLATFFMISYEVSLKNRGFPGNLTIAFLTSALFLYGGAATGDMTNTVIFSMLAFLVSVGREIIKDIEDMEGDEGRKTLPMKIGKKRAKMVAAAFISGGVALSPLPYIISQVGISFIPLVAAADGIFIYAVVILPESEHRAQKMCKFGMLAALVAFVIGVI